MQLEFEYLSLISGDQRFSDTIAHVTDYVVKKQPKNGLYPNYLHPKTGNWGTVRVNMPFQFTGFTICTPRNPRSDGRGVGCIRGWMQRCCKHRLQLRSRTHSLRGVNLC